MKKRTYLRFDEYADCSMNVCRSKLMTYAWGVEFISIFIERMTFNVLLIKFLQKILYHYLGFLISCKVLQNHFKSATSHHSKRVHCRFEMILKYYLKCFCFDMCFGHL